MLNIGVAFGLVGGGRGGILAFWGCWGGVIDGIDGGIDGLIAGVCFFVCIFAVLSSGWKLIKNIINYLKPNRLWHILSLLS